MNSLSLCMIVKNGEKYIEQSIESILPVVSEIIVVDTGSTDNTLDKIRRFEPHVYQIEWDNDFAKARNISLSYAKGDYLIVLDADEIIYDDDLPKLVHIVENTTADCISIRFHNLIDENDENSFNIHEGLRILKKGSYHYEGAIHEQPIFNFTDRKAKIEHSGVRIKHYGYLKSNTGAEKFERNMTILEKVIKENPEDPFHLFNIGNQYMSIGDYKTALEYYEKADNYKNTIQAYCPHLLFRRAACLRTLRKNDECLTVIAEGLKIYPQCTDLEFLRALTLTVLKRFTLAIDSFKRCLEMGPSPPNLSFLPNVGDVRPLIELAKIYSEMDDYEKALGYYLKALKTDGNRYYLIYKVAHVLNKIFPNKDTVYQNISNLFADSNHKPNVIVMADALLNEKLLTQATLALSKLTNDSSNENDTDILFLKGRLIFYKKQYESAILLFKDAISPKACKGILPNIKKRSYEYIITCNLLNNKCHKNINDVKENIEDPIEKAVYLALLSKTTEESKHLDAKSLDTIANILSKLLSVQEYDAFEKALTILNKVESNNTLLSLAKVYFDNNFHGMAVKMIIKSIKELDALDSKAVRILNKEFI